MKECDLWCQTLEFFQKTRAIIASWIAIVKKRRTSSGVKRKTNKKAMLTYAHIMSPSPKVI